MSAAEHAQPTPAAHRSCALGNRRSAWAPLQRIGSAPSVLFDAVAILPGKDSLATTPAALTFLTEAFQHCKYIGWSEAASALVAVCALAGAADDAFCALTDTASIQSFVKSCKALRHWPREALFQI